MNTDIVVIGGGHAGVEAAYIAAKKGVRVILVTMNVDLIAQMSCNPSIGGIAKGNIVREIDALGGLMGKIIDRAGIHFRMLNKSKGAAVWGNRAQADKVLYRKYCRCFLEQEKNVTIFQDCAIRLLCKGDSVSGVETESGEKIEAKAVILAMGTFLNGVAHIGSNSFMCGRRGEPSSLQFSESIQEYGISAGRLKTGTPARIDGRTVDYSQLREQKGDEKPWPFSFSTSIPLQNKIVCWESRTNKKTHDIIRDNLDKSPLYTGKIKSIGPRYCPSIEDKVVRFGDRSGHTLFLEPEGLDYQELYLNGFSTSLPYDVQVKMIQSISGLQQTRMIRPAYAIEYDYFYPVQLLPTLESRKIKNLYFAGQINGTSGYEEAACQGLMAGINAAEKILGNQELILGRDDAYIGVLIDDLVTKGTDEPYRMFTSRAEYRLLLRQDNADQRLMPVARDRKLISDTDTVYKKREQIWKKREEIKKVLSLKKIIPEQWHDSTTILNSKISALEFLKRPYVTLDKIMKLLELHDLDHQDSVTVEADIKYEGFIVKQKKEIERLKKLEKMVIPENIDFDTMGGLLSESRMKLKKIKPYTVGQASRISGITPSDISLLIMNILKNNN